MSNQSSVVGSAISIGCNMLHITSQVSRTIIDIVDIPIKNSKCKVVKLEPVAKYLNKHIILGIN